MEKNTLSNLVYNTTLSALDEIFVANQNRPIWKERPVTFRIFAESPEHMGIPALSERQFEVADFLLGNDPEKIFDNGNTIAVLCFGKGSGKDLLSALILLYVVHVLLCMTSPQKFFGMLEGEAIDMLNVAVNADQASSVFFDKFIQRVKRWKWLRDRYSLKISGIFLGQAKPEELLNSVVITKNGVLFPNNLRAFSGHSEESSQEGKNLLCWVADEIAAFDETPGSNRGQRLFDMMKSSAVSRFGSRFKGLALSFPRYKDDAILSLYEQAKGELHWYSDIGATWDIKPASLFKDFPEKYFEFEGNKIPLEFEQEFRLNPTEAKAKFLCQPPDIEQGFIEYPEKVEACIDYGRPPIVVLEDYADSGEVKKSVNYFNVDSVYRDYIVTIDLGLKSDSAALSVFHRDFRVDGDYVIQDLITAWVPEKNKGLKVSIINIEEIILSLSKHIHIVGVWFDQWNSELLSQRLNQSGLFSAIYRLDFQDYKNFKDRLYDVKIRLLNDPVQTKEIKRLVLLKGGKVDHPVSFSKDRADTLVGAVKVLTGKAGGMSSTIPSPLGGEMIVGSNLAAQGGTLI
jgi:hypothetical protein